MLVPSFTPPVLVEPEKIITVLAPMLAMPFCRVAFDPSPISVMAMTAATAMIDAQGRQARSHLVSPQRPQRRPPGGRQQRRHASAAAIWPKSRHRTRRAAPEAGSRLLPDCRFPAIARPRPVLSLVALDHSIHDVNGPMGVIGHFGIMRDQDDGDSCRVELLEHAQDFDARVRIEIAGRLIGENERRAIDQGPGDRDTLLLSARHLRRLVIGSTSQPNAVQAGYRPAARLRAAEQRRGNSPAAS